MSRQTVKRLMTKGIMAYVAVFALVLMVAMPALALMADSVGTNEIINHSIRSIDIRNKAVTTDRIAPRAVKRGKIGKRAVRTEHVQYLGDSKIRYSTKYRYLNIPASAFRPEINTNQYDTDLGNGAMYATQAGQPNVYFFAEVDLPQGARVMQVRLVCFDNYNSDNANVKLILSADTGDVDEMASASSSGKLNIFRRFDDNSIARSYIDNHNYFYFARLNLSGNGDTELKVLNVSIKYKIEGP